MRHNQWAAKVQVIKKKKIREESFFKKEINAKHTINFLLMN
jgi:hypothetical protein